MLEVTVKTLDSQNHSFSVPEESTVREFKEQISPVLNIAVDKQRLIFCGKVLKDDKKLNEYDVNGKVIHVVQSLPPQGNSSTSASSSSANSTTSGPRISHRDTAGFVLGAFTIPQDFLDPTQIQQDDTPAVDLRISLGQAPIQSEAQLRMNRVQTMFMRANRLLDSLDEGNGNNSSESSSQTDNDDEINNRLLDGDIGAISFRNEGNVPNGTSGETASGSETQNETSSLPSGQSTTNPTVSERYGLEGLAQVAQAALTAAIAAARAATSSISSQELPQRENFMSNNTESNNATSGDAVPTESTSGFMTSETIPISSSETTSVTMDFDPMNSCECMQTETATQSNKDQSTSNSTSSGTSQNSGTSITITSGTSVSSNTDNSTATSREIQQPNVQTLANLLDEVIKVNSRFEPYLAKCRDLIRNDAVMTPSQVVEAHRLFSRTSQLLHFLSHAFHSLSDLHINYSSPPPRSPRVRIISSTPTLLQHAIPVQAQINISSSIVPSSSSGNATSSNSNATSSTTTTTAPVTASEPRSITSNSSRTTGTLNITRSSNFPRISTSSLHSTMASMMRGHQNPMFFMEVSPGSITIDSISATMDASPTTTLAVPDEESDASSQDTSNPPVSASNQIETRPDSSSQTQTSTTRVTSLPIPPFTTQASTIMPAVRHLIPVPLSSLNGSGSFDSALPCHSVWALDTSRRRHNAGGSRTTSTQRTSQSSSEGTALSSSQQGTPPAITPNAPGRPEEQIQSFLNSIVTNLNHSNPLNQALTMLTNVALREHRPNRSDNGNQNNRERQTERSENNRSSSMFSDVLVNMANMNDQIFQDIVQGIRTTSPSETVNMSVAQFLLGDRTLEIQENDIVSRAFWFVARQLTLNDFLEVSFGNCDSFNRLKEPLQKYINEKIFPQENTEDENKAIIEQMVSNFDDLMEPFVRTLNIKSNVDYKETMRNFFRHNVNVLKNALQGPIPDSVQFGNFICNLCHSIFLEFLYVHNTCVEDGNQSLQTAANTIINSLCSGTMHSFRMAVTFMVSRLLSRDPSTLVDVEVARSHIVYKTASGSSSPVTPPIIRTYGDKFNRAKSNSDRSERPRYSDSLQNSERETAPTLSAIARIVEQTRNSGRTSDTRSPAADSLTEVVIGSEAWHNTLPRDWVPIIARDVQRQRRQAPQSPFSNAYLGGVPTKRRKIMTNGTPALLGHSQSTLSDMLQQAISSANVKPLSSCEEVKKDASQDLTLQTAFTLHMKNAIQERLQRDLDYCSEKFPNAKKYYNVDKGYYNI